MNTERTDTQAEGTRQAAQPSLAETSARLIAEQTAVMTMMTAASVNFAAQMTGMFMGAFADALEGQKPQAEDKPQTEQKPKAEDRPRDEEKVVPLRVVKTSPAVRTDDLKRISGIGPRLEKVLHGMGIRSFAEIAKWDDAEMRRIDEELGLDNRVIRDDWVGQAKALLEG